LYIPEEWQGTAGAKGVFTTGKADLDNGGEVGTNEGFAYARAIGPMPWEGAFSVGQLSGGYSDYNWGGKTRFFEGQAAEDPFDNFESYRATGAMLQGFAPEWGLAGALSLSYSAETGANLNDGRGTLYGLGGWYRWDDGFLFDEDTMFLALGAVASDAPATRGRDWSFFPAIQMIWNIGPQTEFFILGNQAMLIHTFADFWRVALSARYESFTFRTEQDGAYDTKVVATDSYAPVMLNVIYQPSMNFDIRVGVGALVGRMITVDYGPEDEKDKVDAQPAFKLQFIWYF
jgi:hypothetical protein